MKQANKVWRERLITNGNATILKFRKTVHPFVGLSHWEPILSHLGGLNGQGKEEF